MEEATIAAVNGEIDPFVAGVAYCPMIAACRDTTDYRRASEWTEAAQRWCERQSINGFPGICRVHRAEIVALQGALDRAEQELLQATTELAAYNAAPPLADGFYALGEIRFKLGDLEGAEDALRQAHALGRSPQPALALMRLTEGKIQPPLTAINAALPRRPATCGLGPGCSRPRSEIAVAAGDARTARPQPTSSPRSATSRDSPVAHGATHDARAACSWPRGTPKARAASSERRSATGRRWGRRTRWRGTGRSSPRRCERLGQDDETRLELRGGARRSSSGWAPCGMLRRRPTRSGRPTSGAPPRSRSGRRSCSPTSSVRRTSPRPWATRPGSTCCAGTTTRCGRCSASTAARS